MPLSTSGGGWGYISLHREFGGEGLLLDVNYLSDLFQKGMALAAERVFTKARPKILRAAVRSRRALW